MDQSGRLPSFKPPRDLTLSRGGGVSRNRRTYAPNIPPPRGKAGKGTDNDSSGTSITIAVQGSSKSTSITHEPAPSKGNVAPNSNAERGRKKRGELVQSESIFCQGVGDPTLANRKLASVPSMRGRGGSSSVRSVGGRKSYLGKSQLEEILKKREKDENEDEDDWMGSNFVEYSDDDEEDTVNDISIPLSSYLHEERTLVGPSCNKSGNTVLNAKLEANSFANIFHATDKNEDKLMLIQLPSRLPILDQAAAEASKSSSTNVTPTLESLSETIDALPEGPIGKIQIMASGKSRFVLGENVFDLQHGASISFLQELATIDLEDKQLINLGPVSNKFILSPNLDVLLKQPP